MYKATNGKKWKNNTNWLNYEVPLSKWHDVETDSQGRIIGLTSAETGFWRDPN